MIELENPQIEPVEEAGTYAKYEAGPLQAGYGVTLGNALRRVLLSSLDAAKLSGTVADAPRRDQMPLDLNEQLVVEYYSR
jgi:ribosomal protein S4